MVSRVTHVTQAPPTAQAPAANKKVAPPKPQPVKATDVVQLSAAAQALQEVTETPQQTAKEAMTGDRQALLLLAREAAAKADMK